MRESLTEALRRLARRTDVDQLKRSGVRQVNVLGLDRIGALVEEAVHRSLKHRLLGADREAVTEATKAEFLKLLHSKEALERSHDELARLKQRAEEEVESLRLELQRQQQSLAERLRHAADGARAGYEGKNAEIAATVGELFAAALATSPPDLAALRERILECFFLELDRERRETLAAREAAKDREIDVLERRIAKMSHALEHSEARLRELGRTHAADPGIASVYREVQGLDRGESQFQRKKELMAVIFQANLALQKGASEA
ncbi:MAG: hypothetical protein IT458_06080 [Planctomycetes bacterium]|nr:hypothetical protein [Planctomycetota bacterium]